MIEKGERSGGVECWLDRVKIGFGVEAKYSFAVDSNFVVVYY